MIHVDAISSSPRCSRWTSGSSTRPPAHLSTYPPFQVDKLLAQSPFIEGSAARLHRHAGGSGGAKAIAFDADEMPAHPYLLSFVGSVRFHTPGYSMGVRQAIFRVYSKYHFMLCYINTGVYVLMSIMRQAIFRRYNATARFFLRDLRGDSKEGVHKKLESAEYLAVLQQSKFCLAPSGMGFSTRSYEAIAQGCVPLVIQDEPLSNTTVDQAFEELLPWAEFSLRLYQRDIPNLPTILDAFPMEKWRELRRALACVWPRLLWLQSDNEAPGDQLNARAWGRSDATAALGSNL